MALVDIAQITDNHRPGAIHHAAGQQIRQKTAEPFGGDHAAAGRTVIRGATEQHAGHLQHFQPLFQQRAVGYPVADAAIHHLRLNTDDINLRRL
ncbi:hypothetical protein D3C77_655910 [compost metagenome]